MDTKRIEGYENMSAEEKVAALEALEFDSTGFIRKDVFDKTASELAEWKRKYNSTLSEAEQARLAAEEARKATEERLAELERKDKISTAKDKYIASGFDVAMAQSTAEAFVDGNMDRVFENINAYAAKVVTEARDKALKDTPVPPASGNPNPGKINYSAEREKALAEGDFTRAAQLARLETEQK